MAVGERWRLVLKLKPPHGMANPDQWDTVWRVRRQGIGAVGRVVPGGAAERLSAAGWQLSAWLQQRIVHSAISPQAQRWLIGMIVGDDSAFDAGDWQLFNDTGITHLVIVSGSHVTLAVGFWSMLLQWLLRRLWPRRYRLMPAGRVIAALMGTGYAVLAQGGAPAVRACVALLPWVLALKSAWRPSRWQLWWLALLSIVLWLPWSLLMPGVWLSFGAVAALYVIYSPRRAAPSLWHLLTGHLLLTLAIDGALLFMMGRWAPVSLAANIIAIPWVSLLLLPLGMLGGLVVGPLPAVAGGCWSAFDFILRPLIALLAWGASHCPAQLYDPRPAAAAGLGMMAVAVSWMLPAVSWRWRLITLAGSALLVGQRGAVAPKVGDFTVTVLDVGQGQLVELRTHSHRYLFDTGPQRYGGRRVIEEVWPAAQRFDAVIVSHGDMDHAGGIPVLSAYHQVGQWWVPWRLPVFNKVVSDRLLPEPSLCRAGVGWNADDIHFRFLWPRPDMPLPAVENDRSCVLLVEGKGGSALLTGDATVQVEGALLNELNRPISVWVAGHHGSHGSNSRALLMRTHPLAMLYSAGYANPYHHPSLLTVARVADSGARQWNTAEFGAITATVYGSGAVGISSQRAQQTVVLQRL